MCSIKIDPGTPTFGIIIGQPDYIVLYIYLFIFVSQNICRLLPSGSLRFLRESPLLLIICRENPWHFCRSSNDPKTPPARCYCRLVVMEHGNAHVQRDEFAFLPRTWHQCDVAGKRSWIYIWIWDIARNDENLIGIQLTNNWDGEQGDFNILVC